MSKKESRLCFFCMENEASRSIGNLDVPPPLDPDTRFMMCDLCEKNRSSDEKAQAIIEYVNQEREEHNAKVLARRQARLN